MQLHKAMVPTKMNSKAQIATLDTAIAILTALSLISLTTIHTYNIVDRSTEKEERINLQKELYFATESLITTPGEPLDWEKTRETERIGLAKYRENTVQNHQLDSEKTHSLKEKPLEEIKQGLGLGHRDVKITIQEINGEQLLNKTDIDKNSKTTQIKRIALMEGEKHVIKLKAKQETE